MRLTALLARVRFRQARITWAPWRAKDLAVSKPEMGDRRTGRQGDIDMRKKKVYRQAMPQRWGFFFSKDNFRSPSIFSYNLFHWVTQWSSWVNHFSLKWWNWLNYCGSRLFPLVLDKVLDLTANSQWGIAARIESEKRRLLLITLIITAVIMKTRVVTELNEQSNRHDIHTEPWRDISGTSKGLW